ncbi:hypothetical protein ARMGADRAFT_200296 [Armillaria gallica]|uniref:Uncharacterized protein n=1 Tax=Armillaria gallica TaxID=47427 RepID=A0A2H3D829_ARMGA|nr:hypothetical protein ARMGADRAFT_200296 [Armillaria gallica]
METENLLAIYARANSGNKSVITLPTVFAAALTFPLSLSYTNGSTFTNLSGCHLSSSSLMISFLLLSFALGLAGSNRNLRTFSDVRSPSAETVSKHGHGKLENVGWSVGVRLPDFRTAHFDSYRPYITADGDSPRV